MHKFTCLILLLLATGLSAQTQRPNTFLQTGPNPADPTQLGDFEPPVITCLNGLSVNIMPTGLLTIWANDLIGYVDDNATPSNLITVGIRKAGTGVGFPADSLGNTLAFVQFYCADVGQAIPLEIWAKDGSGNLAFCTTSLSIYDISGGCNGGNTVNVHMCAKVLCSGEMMENVIFYINGSVNFAPPFSYFDLTNQDGCSEINNNVPVASTFTVMPEKDDNPLNGSVDAQDFEILSKHLNGTEPFTEPWQWVAADANRDGLITLEDSMEFRNLALGIYLELPYNTSWRFVPEGYQFPSPNPLSQPLPESLLLEDVFSNKDSIFWGIKIGDLNCSASPNLTTNPTENRTINNTAKRDTPTADPTQLGDFEPPVITCLNGLSASIMPTGLLTIWANDLIWYVDDNATPSNLITVGIRKAGAGTGFPMDSLGNTLAAVQFSCDDVAQEIPLEIWAKDGSGNFAFCTTTIAIQDNGGSCNGGNTVNIHMCAKVLCSGEMMEEVIFFIDGSVNFAPPFSYFDLTNQDGCSEINNNVPMSSTFSVWPQKDDNPLNGSMDAQDFEILRKHLDGTEPFTEPWQWVAADANRDGLITPEDTILFRNLALGIYTELPDNSSWRFVPEGYQFPSPNPLSQPFPESLLLEDVFSNMDSIFLGIKIGDLNCSASPNLTTNPTENRTINNTAKRDTPTADPTQLGDFEPPVLICLNGLSVNIMPTGLIQLWQTDYLSAVSDNATPVNQIKLAVQKAGAGTEFPTDVLGNPLINTLFTCNELGTQGVELWAKDLAGNTTKCLTNVIIQDNLGNCGGAQADWLIRVCTESVEELIYDIAGVNPNGPFVAQDLSDQIGDGCGNFEVPLGSNVVVAPIKDDNPLNGVTTYDIVLITRHYHGIELLDSPYKLIAADANRDGLVNELDSAEIRHLILGMTTEFPNNNSWRFVDKNYVFPDPSNPFAATFPESLTIQNIQSPVTADFIGIKIGDVNNTAVHNFEGGEIDERGFESEMLWVGTPNPNPTSAGAGLPIYLPAAENLYLEIADLTGKILWSNTLQREKGSHLLEIPAQAMPNAGLYLWRLRAGGEFRAGKLLRW